MLFRRLTVLIAFLFAHVASAEDVRPADRIVVQMDERVAGETLNTYANRWWEWAYSMPQRDSPVRDRDGQRCHINQTGQVWFLAGGFGTSKIERSCDIPTGQHLFFPIINMVVYNPPGGSRTCEAVKRAAAQNNDRFVYLRASLNGIKIDDVNRFRIASDTCFDPLSRVPAVFSPPSFAPAATDGYWLMLRPLPVGQHQLAFSAFYTNEDEQFGDMVQNISYTINVRPPD